jgi:hypothetical protein
MAGKVPFFLTGCNAIIRVNNYTIAFATDVAFSTKIRQQSPRVLSKYEVETHVPLSYDVAGQFTIIRYARGIAGLLGATTVDKTNNNGNGLGSMGITSIGGTLKSAADLSSALQVFKTGDQDVLFDIEIQQKIQADTTTVFKLKGCRIDSIDIKMSKKGATTQSMTFKAVYFDDDTQLASNGVGGNKELQWQ